MQHAFNSSWDRDHAGICSIPQLECRSVIEKASASIGKHERWQVGSGSCVEESPFLSPLSVLLHDRPSQSHRNCCVVRKLHAARPNQHDQERSQEPTFHKRLVRVLAIQTFEFPDKRRRPRVAACVVPASHCLVYLGPSKKLSKDADCLLLTWVLK